MQNPYENERVELSIAYIRGYQGRISSYLSGDVDAAWNHGMNDRAAEVTGVSYPPSNTGTIKNETTP
jgi:hypothetical protein